MILQALHDLRRDAAITWGYGGAREIWEAFLERAIYRLYRRRTGRLFEEDLTEISKASPPAGVEVRVLADRDWASLTRALTTRSLKRFGRRMTPQTACLIAWRGERPVGYAWLSKPGAKLEELPLPLPPDAVYGSDLWVDPRERSRGVGSALVRARLRYARERGFLRAWRIIFDGNRPSLRTLERSSGGGAQALGKVVYLTFLGQTRAWYEPAAGNIHSAQRTSSKRDPSASRGARGTGRRAVRRGG